MTRAELKMHAKASLNLRWGVAIGVLLLESIINVLCSSFLSITLISGEAICSWVYSTLGIYLDSTYYSGISLDLLTLVVSFPLSVGAAGVYLKLVRGEVPKWTDLFDGFQLCFVQALIAGLLITAITDVATILLIVPGVIVSLGLSQTAYILRDQPELPFLDAMKASWSLMNGHKMELFVLRLSFLGWNLLCILIIPLFYVGPYQSATYAAYYDSLTGRLSR